MHTKVHYKLLVSLLLFGIHDNMVFFYSKITGKRLARTPQEGQNYKITPNQKKIHPQH
jgi:hypothetical protein